MYDSRDVVEKRPKKENLDPFKPYLYLHEKEPGLDGSLKTVNVLFLTNKECPFKCVYCDLWKYTLDNPTLPGAIPKQINYALNRLPDAKVIKLYNNGNFFDTTAIPKEDYKSISELLKPFERVIVENHPRFCNENILRFQELLHGQLEIAIGLETIHPEVLPMMNKQMTTESFSNAVSYVARHGITTRAFVLLNPPYLKGKNENIDWCIRSVKFAFKSGVQTCSLIPTRGGNGVMDSLLASGLYEPPTLSSFEEAFKRALLLNKGRVIADTWDLNSFSTCSNCFQNRKDRLDEMNLKQRVVPGISCDCQ